MNNDNQDTNKQDDEPVVPTAHQDEPTDAVVQAPVDQDSAAENLEVEMAQEIGDDRGEVTSGDPEVVVENEISSADLPMNEDEPLDPAKEVPTDSQTIIEGDVSSGSLEGPAPKDQTGEVKEDQAAKTDEQADGEEEAVATTDDDTPTMDEDADSPGRWYVVHTYSGHENRVATTLKQRVEAEHLEGKIFDVLVPTQDKIEIRGGKKETIKEKIFPGYILVNMIMDDDSWLAVRTTQGVTSFVGAANKPTPIPAYEVKSIVNFMQQGSQPTYKMNLAENDTVKIVDGPFTEFIGKVDGVDQERGKVKVLVSIFGRETPVELDFVQVQKL